MIGDISKELLTFNGMVLVHDNLGELEFIMTGVKVIPCPDSIPQEERLPIRAHPDFAAYEWPLKKADFR